MLPSPVCGVSPISGRFPEEESLEPPTGLKATCDTPYVAFLKATGPMSPSQPRGRLCFRRFRFRFTVPVAPVLVP
ncbi:hypothetical protein Taro_017251 [Colocasia esculenta]|uniref:Uncharacterized protein n=1 Tax=Colocasia esculenta TaxID=4460 RepID=A0A843UYV2_COLES|nr:hypothetical protein [Colocasia esculenta]